MTAQEIIEKIRAEVNRLCNEHLSEDGWDRGYNYACEEIMSILSDLEKSEESKRVRTLEKEFDGYNPIVVTLDKYVLGGIGIGRNDKAIIKIQRKED